MPVDDGIRETPLDYHKRLRAQEKNDPGSTAGKLNGFLFRIDSIFQDKRKIFPCCGAPYTEDSISPYECKSCWIKHLAGVIGREAAEERFNELKEKQFDFLIEHERRKAQKLKVTVGDTEINLN